MYPKLLFQSNISKLIEQEWSLSFCVTVKTMSHANQNEILRTGMASMGRPKIARPRPVLVLKI